MEGRGGKTYNITDLRNQESSQPAGTASQPAGAACQPGQEGEYFLGEQGMASGLKRTAL